MQKRLIILRAQCSIWALLGILLSLLACPVSMGDGHALTFRNVENSEGDWVTGTTSLIQDNNGFLYMATFDGLHIYNGYDYETFENDPSDPFSISGNWINCLFKDSEGNVWAGTRNGLNRFNQNSGTFTRCRHGDPKSENNAREPIDSIAQDKNGALWLGIPGGLVKFDTKTNQSTRYQIQASKILTLHVDRFGIIWAGTSESGLFSFNPESETFKQYTHDPETHDSLSGNAVRSIVGGDDGNLWIGTLAPEHGINNSNSNDLSRFNRETDSFSQFKLDRHAQSGTNSQGITAMTKDSSGQLWVATASCNIYKFDPMRLKAVHMTEAQQSDAVANSLLVDRSGILWIGSTFTHTLTANTQQLGFTIPAENRIAIEGLKGRQIKAILEDRQGTFWVGTRASGLFRYSKETGSFVNYTGDKSPGTNIRFIYEDKRGKLWIGTSENGLCLFDRENDTIEKRYRHPSDENVGLRNAVFALEDPQNNFWVGYRAGFYLLDRDTGAFTNIPLVPENAPSSNVFAGATTSGLVDKNGMLWVGTIYGISIVDPNLGAVRLITNDPNDPKSLSSSLVRAIEMDFSGTVWVGTDRGLNRYNQSSNTFERFYAESGLPSGTIRGILENEFDQNIWVTTSKGIARYDSLSNQFIKYNQDSGLQNNSFSQQAHFNGSDGIFYLGGPNGLDAFKPRMIQPDHPPAIRMISLRNGNERTLSWYELLATRERKVSFSNNNVSFGFTVLDYLDSRRNQYRYKLEGFDEQWVEAGSRNFAGYTNLPPGEFVFHVQGANSRGVWSEEDATIALTITPMLWQTAWFKIAGAFALAMTLYFSHKWITARIRKRNAELNKAINEAAKATQATIQLAEKADAANVAKSRFLANMSHEIRTPLNGVMGMLGLLQMTELDEEQQEISSMADSSARSLLSLLSDILNISKIEAEEISLDLVDFAVRPLARETEEILRSKAAEKSLEISVDIDANIPDILIGDPGRLRQILLNLMMNAIKFTEKGSIDLRLIAQDQDSESVSIRFEVADSGIGIAKEQQVQIFNAFSQIDSSNKRKYDGAGLGLSISKQFVKLMGGEMGVDSSEGCGSVFWFTLTLDRSKAVTQKELPFDEFGPQKAAIKKNGGIANKHRGGRILIAEDNKVNQRVSSSILRKLGWDTALAEDGESCLKQYRPGAFDIILMDCQMPGLDGYETAQRLREFEPKGERVPIIALTARAMEGDRKKCLDAGMDDYMSKPVTPAKLEQMVNKWAFQSPRSRQHSPKHPTASD